MTVRPVRGSPIGSPVVASQRQTAPSLPAEASTRRPSGPVQLVSDHTGPLWPVSGPPIGSPVVTSQRRTTPSPPPEARIRRPSGAVQLVSAVTRPGAARKRPSGPDDFPGEFATVTAGIQMNY